MALPADLPVVDHHCHLSPTGEGVEAARRFRKAGGTHLFLATQAYGPGVPTTVDGYQAQFETTTGLAQKIQAEIGVVVYPVVAPYPVDLVSHVKTLGLPAAEHLYDSALALSGRWVEDQRAVAIGEVGRPHFDVDPEVRELADSMFVRALEVGRDVGCPVVVHAEDLNADGYAGLASVAARTSFPVSRLIKHYQRSIVPPEERAGVVPSYLARRDLAGESLGQSGPWFWETDFLDDPRRPGAVLDLETVPRRAAQAASRAPEQIDRLRIPFVESIRQVYGFVPVVGTPRPP